MNRKGMHGQVVVCLCEMDPHLQVAPGQRLNDCDGAAVWCNKYHRVCTLGPEDRHVFLPVPLDCLPALPRTLSVPASASLACSPVLPHPCVCLWGFFHQTGVWLLPGKEEYLLPFEAKAAFLLSAHAGRFGRTGAEQMLSYAQLSAGHGGDAVPPLQQEISHAHSKAGVVCSYAQVPSHYRVGLSR